MNLVTRKMPPQAAVNQLSKIPGGKDDLRRYQTQMRGERAELEKLLMQADQILYRIGAALGEVEG